MVLPVVIEVLPMQQMVREDSGHRTVPKGPCPAYQSQGQRCPTQDHPSRKTIQGPNCHLFRREDILLRHQGRQKVVGLGP